MKIFSLLCLFLITAAGYGQDNPTEKARPIVEEGKRLYRAEMASWYGTDLFLAKYKKKDNIGGYLSYSEGDTSKCIFFSRSATPVVIGTISFDESYNTRTAIINLNEREFTNNESDLYKIRKISLDEINSDTMFRRYNNTNLNLVPLIVGNERKVFVLTGPEQSGLVIFGNDYLLTFDNNNNLTSKRQLHKNIITTKYGTESEGGQVVIGAMHSHLPETGEFITSTDICTLMLYSKFAKWTQHNVVSKNYLNIWNCVTNTLTVVPMPADDGDDDDSGKKKRRKSKT